jgi:cell envelope opacity-associated protein A
MMLVRYQQHRAAVMHHSGCADALCHFAAVLQQTLKRLESELAFKVHALAEAERESAQAKRELEQQRQVCTVI